MSSVHVPADLRRLVRERAGLRCEYCLIPESATYAVHEIDHVVAIKHGGQTSQDNLALACICCNQHKGTDLTSIDPQTGEIVPLFNPRMESWDEHFRLAQDDIEALSPTGRVSARLLQFNTAARCAERRLLLEAGLIQVPE